MNVKTIASIVIVTLLVLGTTPVTAGELQSTEITEEQLRVEVDSTGDAVVTLVSTYELTNEADKEAFNSLRDDENATDDLLNRHMQRMQAVAQDTTEATRREMTVSNPQVNFRVDGTTGVVMLSVEWSNLAAVDNNKITVTEPFSSGFGLDRDLVIIGPDSSTITGIEPQPDNQDAEKAVWEEGTALQGLTVTFTTPKYTTIAKTATPGQPGFGIVVAVVALLTAILLAVRHRD